MPRDIEHRVDMLHLAQDRRDAGRPIWDRTIQVGDLFHNEGLEDHDRRDQIVQRVRDSGWPALNETVQELVDELAEVTSEDEFNAVWDLIYDEADYDRVWIETIIR